MRAHQGEVAYPAHQAASRGLVRDRECRFEQDGLIHHETRAEPTLRHIGYAMSHRLRGRAQVQFMAAKADHATIRFVDAEKHTGDLRASASDEAAETQNLAGTHMKT